MEVLAPAYETPNEVPVETDMLQMDYPKQQYAVGALLIYLTLLGLCVGMLGVAYKSWVLGIYVPAVYISIVAGINLVIFVPKVVKLCAAWVRGVRDAWWLRLSTTGFAINDRVFGPARRHKWCEIQSFELVPRTGADGRVGFRYSPECHRFRPRRRSKPDGYVGDHWDRPVDEAVELMTEWLTRYRAS